MGSNPYDREQTRQELQARGLNITPGKGRHKLTLLRERGAAGENCGRNWLVNGRSVGLGSEEEEYPNMQKIINLYAQKFHANAHAHVNMQIKQSCFLFFAEYLNHPPQRQANCCAISFCHAPGYFIPVDPSNAWLDRVSNDPQPSGWKDAMKKALGEVPRFDGF